MVGVGFLGCDQAPSLPQKSYGDSLVIITYHPPTSINPLTSVSSISSLLVEVVFDGLVRIGEDLEARPSLASSWQISDNGLRWTFLLRRGVRFHDGVEFTARDVKFTLDEIVHSKSIGLYTGGLADLINSIQIRDTYTVEILLKRPSPSFIYNMEVGILPAHLLQGKGPLEEFGLHPVGTGSFRLSQWKEKEITLEANRDYFLGRPYLDKIVVRVYPSQELAWARLMRGEGDFFGPVDPSVYDFLKQVRPLQIYHSYNLHYSIVVFNNDREPFHDRRVRRALNYAIDKGYMIQKALMGKGRPAAGPVWPRSWAYDPAVKPYPYDPRRALALLREAGWRDTDGDHILDKEGKRFSFTLVILEGDETKRRTAMYLQQQLWEVGILMDVKTFPAASIDFLFQGEFDAVLLEIYSHVYPDFSYNVWHSSQIGRGANIGHYRSGIVDELIENARRTQDREDARRIYYKFQEEIHDNPPGIFLYWADTLIGVHKRFRGVKFSPTRSIAYVHEWYVPKQEQKYNK
ncbi:MAG: hypothetical protein HZC13_06985 [Nitrospirae bacterium]|nr:hypothetical protein [Nitrospirota bacterium]